ncbi:hypothetical protein GQ43DRAFT_445484 [Delitschia confertaspora ATCC 74209]|uniref:Uncharacterized protein n=1 Tax=Delitschia confertaspora ATCC 74209 TaxID=1513339 RepID=A0A9P4MMK3_9PLEO|nr:hypothetical protein GQ43DRAFT_445484 [Delitschia confertaspora ATCC 74209]
MKSVPTLCATATVVGASAVGLSFGRPEHSLDTSNKRKATPARAAEADPMPSAVQTSCSTNASLPLSAPILSPSSRSARVPVAVRTSHDGRQQRKIARRMTSGDAGLYQHDIMNNGYAPSSDGDLDDVNGPLNFSSRPWMKRLSAISTSRNSSRNSSPGRLTPTVSCSNGSMAFSHDGSTAPIVSSRPPSPRAPNKLVKRSSSVHIHLDSPSQSPSSRLPPLRRPATSHQRSAALQRHSVLMEMPVEHLSDEGFPPPSKVDDDIQYTHFFSPKVSKGNSFSKKLNSSGNSKDMKRIFPDGKHQPTLLLAQAVSAYTEEIDDSSSQDADSVYLGSRPGTPLSMTAVVTPQGDGESGPSVDAPEETRPRRSFSISDFLSSGSNLRKQRTMKLPGGKLTRKSSQRVDSAPLATMGNGHSGTAHGELFVLRERRELTDPAPSKRAVSTSAGPNGAGEASKALHAISVSPLPSLPRRHTVGIADGVPEPALPGRAKRSTSSSSRSPPSPTLVQTGGRPSRHSVAPSEQASTLVGSDNEARGVGSGDEDDADLQSETVFDSLRTSATRNTSGARGPRIETIFDESPPQTKVKVTALRDLLPKGTFREQIIDGTTRNHCIAEEEESACTPVRAIVPDKIGADSPSISRTTGIPLFPTLVSSSPSDMPKPLSLGTLAWDTRPSDDDDSRWSLEDEEQTEPWGHQERMSATHDATPMPKVRQYPDPFASAPSTKPSTPQHPLLDHNDRDARSSIFDWSEQQPTDKSSGNRTPPRPRTVHGKKDADRRGTRSVSRRAPSGLHARSQSVPVVPDVAGNRSTVVTNKFGTWGVGSKGVTEDWNEDFDFTDLNDAPAGAGLGETQRIDSGTAMFVPKTIQEQQSNVLANIGLLREWGLLIEELKEQRYRADNLGILDGPNAAMWEEVDAMIDLADQEAEENGIPCLSSPSSPGFDEDAFDDVSGSSPTNGRGRRRSNPLASATPTNGSPPALSRNRSRRKSILPPNHDIFGPQSAPLPSSAAHAPATTPPSTPFITRPRKDSEAKAQSIIEALQKRKSTHESIMDLQLAPATEKVPFDTATLRRIVPYVNGLTRRVKDALREAEGLYSSPSTSPKDPPFSKIFTSDNDLATQMKLMTVM